MRPPRSGINHPFTTLVYRSLANAARTRAASNGTGVLKDINIEQTPQIQPADEMPMEGGPG